MLIDSRKHGWKIENIIRNNFKVERNAYGGMVDAKYISEHQMEVIGFVLLALDNGRDDVADLEAYKVRAEEYFTKPQSEYDEIKVDKLIDEFERLVKKHCK